MKAPHRKTAEAEDAASLERFREEPFQHLSEQDVDKYLGNPDVVDAIVRVAISDALQIKAEAEQDEAKRSGAPDAIYARLQRAAQVFLGQTNDYDPLSPEWNSPTGGIVAATRERFGVEVGEPEAVLTYALATILAAVMDAETEETEGRDWEHLIDDAIDVVVRTLSGQGDLTKT